MTSDDEELQILSNITYDGWPETLSQAREFDRGRKQVFELYWNCKDELTADDGLVYRGHRLVIPTKERANIVKSLPESHIGIEGTLRRARDIVYWPGITAQLKDYLSKCGICNRYRPEHCKEPLKPHDVPDLPSEKVGVDLFVMDRQSFLIHWTKKWIYIKFAQRKYDGKLCLLQSKPVANAVNAIFGTIFTMVCKYDSKYDIYRVCYRFALSKHNFASYLHCANLMQIHFFVQCIIARDYYSGYFEVQDMSSTTSIRVITVLKSWFSRHGIPSTVISDNGPPFNSEDFKAFSSEWDFHHITSSPYHPESNGRAENAVKTCKSLLTKARADKRDPLLALLEWRNTSSKGMNASPVQLLYGRRARTRLPVTKSLLVPQVISDVPQKIKSRKQKQKFYYDRHSHELPTLHDGDATRMRLPGNSEWSLGRVVGEGGPRSHGVEVNGKPYRRNRKLLRATPEKLEPKAASYDLKEPSGPGESSSGDVSPPTMLVSPEVPEPCPTSRPVRERRPPVWLKDYECGH